MVMERCKLREEIINFVMNSREDENYKVAVFIAGMQAQKNLMSNRRETNGDKFCVVNEDSPGK